MRIEYPQIEIASTPTAVVAAATSTALLAANAGRKSASVYNASNKILYLKFGTGASASSFKVAIAATGYFEFPQPIYKGAVHGCSEADPTGNWHPAEEY